MGSATLKPPAVAAAPAEVCEEGEGMGSAAGFAGAVVTSGAAAAAADSAAEGVPSWRMMTLVPAKEEGRPWRPADR